MDYEGMILDQELVARHPEMAGFTRTSEDDWNAADSDETMTDEAQAAIEAAYDAMRR